MRLDKYLLLNNYFNSRNKAHMAILNKAIFVNDKLVTKPSYDVLESDIITIKNENILPYVSRGGLKLEGAINSFNLDFNGKTVLDIGASTGGFTDCALKHGAKLVYAVDVGHDQLATELKNDKRVVSLEDTNILSLPTFPEKIDIVLLDCSFVSITNLLDASEVKEHKSIIVGVTQSSVTHKTTYGGRLTDGKIPEPNGKLIRVHHFNGNIVLVPKYVFQRLGNLDYYFTHSKGDFDYGLRANKEGIEIYQVGSYLGECEVHETLDKWCNPDIPFKQRWKMLHRPNGMPPKETFYLEKKHIGILPALFHYITIHIRCLFPKIWISNYARK